MGSNGSEPGAAAAPAGLSHLSPAGSAWMVDVGAKPISARKAKAAAVVSMRPETAARIVAHDSPKGDVLGAARLAGIMAAKRTSELLPLCHPLALTRVGVELAVQPAAGRVEIVAEAEAHDRTGVEMEALTAACIAALTIYDMVKGIDRDLSIGELRLLEKSGGRSGHYRRAPAPPGEGG